MNSIPRKEAIRLYKERKVPRGAFAVRSATGKVWVDSSPNLDAAQNGLWFGLKLGTCYIKSLQAEWNAQDGQGFSFEVLEKLDDDVSSLALRDLLKEKKLHWAAKLGALTK